MESLSGKERRKYPRRIGFWRAVACLPGRAPLNCVVRDISEGGARLEFAQPIRFPAKFQLFIEAHDCEYECEVRHSGDYGVGVQFLTSRACRQPEFVRFGRRPEVPGGAGLSDIVAPPGDSDA